MKIEAVGSEKSQFVNQHNIPSVKAFSDTNVILVAYLEALESLLVLSSTETDSEVILTSMYQNFQTLNSMRSDLDSDLERADIMLEAIGIKLSLGLS
jgi:hypothetical protein